MNARPAEKTDTDQIVGHFINGEVVADTNRPGPVTNPATGKVTRQVAMASKATVEEAIAAAEAAFPAWRDTPPIKRARIMFRFKQLLEEHADEIAAAITDEHGKVVDDAMGEFIRGVEVVEYACGIPELLKGEHSKNVGPRIDSWSEMQPLGVVAGITPFNFPAMVPMWMYPMAIASGNTFVLKPSEKDPTAPIAEYIYSTGTANGKRVQALGGAKNHAVVMPDADVDNAVSALMGAAYGSCGERCMAISVAVCVGDETADAVVGQFKERVSGMKVGNGVDASNDMGPLITKAHHDKVRSYVELGIEEGADLAIDGRDLVVEGHEGGFFLGPCLFDRVTEDMRIYKEEIFGPVLCVVRAESEEDAMRLIDEHEYGNGTCIFTRDGEAARYFADNIKVGMVGINVPLPVPVAYHSFGGWKRSLFGDLYAYGPDSVRFYTRRKTITQRWPSGGIREQAKFTFPSYE